MAGNFMMKHRNLIAPQIRSLSGESAAVLDSGRTFTEFFKELLTTLSKVFDKGRRLREGELLGVLRSLDHLVCKNLTIIRSEHDFIPPTRTRPKGEAHEFRYVFLFSNNGDQYRLVSMRILGTRKLIKVETHQLPAGFRYHAAERYLERTGKTNDALKELGSCLLNNMVFYKLTEDFCADYLGDNLMFGGPKGEGAILGDIWNSEFKAEGFEFRIEGIRQYTHSPIWPSGSCFTAATYVSDELLGMDQLNAVTDVEAWRKDNQPLYDDLQKLSCWKESVSADHPELQRVMAELQALRQSAVAVLDNPNHRQAIDRNSLQQLAIRGSFVTSAFG
jgi:hypothetical protein